MVIADVHIFEKFTGITNGEPIQFQDGFRIDFTMSTRDCFTPFAMTKFYFFSNLIYPMLFKETLTS